MRSTRAEAVWQLADWAIRRRYIVVTAAVMFIASVYLWREVTLTGTLGFPLDDAWIHVRFAQNIVRGNGFAYNPGVPSNGSTAPLWTIIVAACYVLTGQFVVPVKAIGILLLIANCSLAMKLTEFLTGSRGAALLAGFLLALSPRLVWSSLSGMETGLYTFLATSGLILHLYFRRCHSYHQYFSTFAFALATMARPECGLLFVFSVVDRVATGWRVARQVGLRLVAYEACIHGAVFVAALGPYWVYNFRATGLFYPNTFAAKSGLTWVRGGALADWWMVALSAFTEMFLTVFLRMSPAVFVFFLAGLLSLSRIPNAQILWYVLFGFPVVRELITRFGGFNLQQSRYYIHVMLVITVVATIGLYRATKWIARRTWLHHSGTGWAGLLVVASILAYGPAQWRHLDHYGWAVENINDMHVVVGRWLAQNTPPDSVVALHDIGGITVFSDRKIIDIAGLVTPEVLPYIQKPRADGKPLWNEEELLVYLRQVRPDYLVMFPSYYTYLAQQSALFTPVYAVRLPRRVSVVAKEMVVYQTIWSESRQQVPN